MLWQRRKDASTACLNAELELVATDAWLSLARALAAGRKTGPPDASSVSAALAWLDRQRPDDPDYRALVAESARLHAEALEANRPDLRARLRSIHANLARIRQWPPAREHPVVTVNLASQELAFSRAGGIDFTAPVVVGRPDRPTPRVSSQITHLVINPTWWVTRRIAHLDLRPKILADPSYLTENGFRVLPRSVVDGPAINPSSIDWARLPPNTFPFRLVQAPGPKNYLGPVKFVFANAEAIFIHGSPDPTVFHRGTRATSAGCIRMKEPLMLARFLLEDHPRLTPARLEELRDSRREMKVQLREPVEIRVVYRTVVIADGIIKYLPDLYDWDDPSENSPFLLAGVDGRAAVTRIASGGS